MKKYDAKSPVMFYVALVLCFIVLVSFNATSKLYARYATEDSASDSARVAKFSITATEDTINTFALAVEGLRPGEVRQFVITVTNNSEVAINCTITVENKTNNLPLILNPVSQNFSIGQSADVVFEVSWGGSNDSPDFAGKIDLLSVQVVFSQID